MSNKKIYSRAAWTITTFKRNERGAEKVIWIGN